MLEAHLVAAFNQVGVVFGVFILAKGKNTGLGVHFKWEQEANCA